MDPSAHNGPMRQPPLSLAGESLTARAYRVHWVHKVGERWCSMPSKPSFTMGGGTKKESRGGAKKQGAGRGLESGLERGWREVLREVWKSGLERGRVVLERGFQRGLESGFESGLESGFEKQKSTHHPTPPTHLPPRAHKGP